MHPSGQLRASKAKACATSDRVFLTNELEVLRGFQSPLCVKLITTLGQVTHV